ncbi:MAG: Crp/Fnr family transcriptional regulator [Bacteroidales bacterium]|jgi:CRP-like cAMP-binding protein|nr:Crp/Fnr family transcriptional regulator [Bacteroidales bacterium]
MYRNQYIESCLENQNSLFKNLTQKEKEVILLHHFHSFFKKGEQIIEEGEKARGLLYLGSGKIKIFKIGVGGREQILSMGRQYGFMGFNYMFSDSPSPFSVSAVEDCDVVFIDKNPLLKILKKNAELCLLFMKEMSEEIIFLNNRLVSLTQKHIRGRIAETLLLLRDTYGTEPDGKTIRAMLSREDIAHLSNMTTSNAIRTLSNMAAEKLIQIEGRRLMILNNTKLEHISDLG